MSFRNYVYIVLGKRGRPKNKIIPLFLNMCLLSLTFPIISFAKCFTEQLVFLSILLGLCIMVAS